MTPLKASGAEWLGLALSWLYLPGLLNASTAGRWALAGLALPWLVASRPHPLAILWLAYSAISLLWSFDPWTGVGHLWWLSIFVLAMCASQRLSALALGTSLGLLLQLPLVLVQMYGWHGIAEVLPGPAGFFLNKNFLGETAALCCVLMGMQRKPILAIALAFLVYLTHCHEAELGLGLAALVYLLRGRPWLAIASICVLALASWLLFDQLAERDLGYRFAMWSAAFSHLTLWGHGLGSFYALYPAFGDVTTFGRPDHPHNELVLAIFELGIGAIAPITLALLAFWRCPFARPILALAFCELTFGFPLSVPTTCVLFGLLAGAAIRNDAASFKPVAFRRDYLPLRRGRDKRSGGDS